MSDTQNYLIFGATSDLATAFIERSPADTKFTLVARDSEKLNSHATSLRRDVATHTCDLQGGAAVKALVKTLKAEGRKFDGVLCAAGRHEIMPLRLYSEDKFRAMMDSNFFTASNVLQTISPILAPGASIVLTSSAVTKRGAGTAAAYAAAKAAVEGLTQAAALEFAPKKVRVNAIAPGVFHSKMSKTFLGNFNEDQLAGLNASHPLGIGTADDVAGCIEFLLGPDAAWITGQTLVIDGGYSINA